MIIGLLTKLLFELYNIKISRRTVCDIRNKYLIPRIKRNEEKNIIYDLHHPKFNIDEESLKIGIALQLKNIMECLS